MSSVYQRLMSDGAWEVQFKEDTPRAVLEKLVPFNVHLVVTPSEIDVGSSDAVFLAAARYVGPLRRLGNNRLNPGGPGNSMWLSDPDGKGEIIESVITSATGTLSSWITNLLPSSLSSGTVTSPGGTYSNAYYEVSRRQAVDSVCRAFGVEWNVKNDFTVDVGTAATLYRNVAGGDTPAVTVARGYGGRDPQVVGIKSAIETEIDWYDYVSNVIVLGQEVGDAGGLQSFRKPAGPLLDWQRVVVDPSAPAGASSAVATAIYNTLPHLATGRREVKVQTDVFDPAGDLTIGDDVYVWDPENGLRDTTYQVTFQGQLIFPTVMRCVGIKWPIRRGMGVYLRIQNDTFNPVYENVTPYVEFESDTALADVELSTASRPLQVDQYGQLVEAKSPIGSTPWLAYTPTWTSAGAAPAIGNGTLEGFYKREGTTLNVRIRMRTGTTTTYGSANGWTFSLPSGVTAYTGTDHYQILPGYLSQFGVANYVGYNIVSSGGTTVAACVQAYNGAAAGVAYVTAPALTNVVPAAWPAATAGSFVEINGTIEVAP